MSISASQRNPRKSILGSRGYSIHLHAEPTPLTSKSTASGSTLNMNVTTQRRPRKSLLGTHRVSRESLLPVLPELIDSFEETKVQRYSFLPPSQPEIKVQRCSLLPTSEPVNDCSEKLKDDVPSSPNTSQASLIDRTTIERDCILPVTESKSELVHKSEEDSKPGLDLSTIKPSSGLEKEHSPLRKRLDSMFSPSSNDDSFIANETLMITDGSILATTLAEKDDESILATTLVENSNTTICNSETISDKEVPKAANQSTNNTLNEGDNEVVRNFLKLMDSMIEKNTQTVITCTKQMDELQKKINDSNKEIKDLESMRRVLTEKFKLKNEKENIPVNGGLSERITKVRTPLKSSPVASPSKQIIKEMRSTIKFLKTPRVSRVPRSSVLLTPHSMSFCIKSQYEQLLE